MVQSRAADVDRYLSELPEEKADTARAVIEALRDAMPEGFDEAMTWGMPTWEVPLSRYPDTYNGRPLMYCAFAAQKNHYAIYLTSPYQDPTMMKRLEDGFAEAGAKLDMGKSCVRFRKLDGFPLQVIEEIVAAVDVEAFIASHENARSGALTGGARAAKSRTKGT